MNIQSFFDATHKIAPFFWRGLYALHKRNAQAKEPLWPKRCWIPFSVSSQYVMRNYGVSVSAPDLSARCAGLAAWRATQGVYQFDPTVWRSLRDTPITELPCALLQHLPEWAVCIDLSDDALQMRGHTAAWSLAWIDSFKGVDSLIVFVGCSDKKYISFLIELTDRQSIEECLLSTADSDERMNRELIEKFTELATYMNGIDKEIENKRACAAEDAKEISPIVNALLYLCSEKPDITCREHPADVPAMDSREWTLKSGETDYGAAIRPHRWIVGEKTGHAIREAQAHPVQHTGITMAAHIRRAHWHLYWTGRGRTEPRLNWLFPMLINGEEGQEE